MKTINVSDASNALERDIRSYRKIVVVHRHTF